MERPFTIKPLSIQDENATFNHKKPTVDGKSKTSGPVAKKAGVAHESRKALNDITNKKSICREASLENKTSKDSKCNIIDDGHIQRNVFEAELLSKKSNSLIEKLNIAEEGFLHDHCKCVQAQKAASSLISGTWFFLDMAGVADMIDDRAKHNPDIERTDYLKLEELSMSEFSELWYKSPPSSPTQWDSPTSPLSWDFEPIELTLKEDVS